MSDCVKREIPSSKPALTLGQKQSALKWHTKCFFESRARIPQWYITQASSLVCVNWGCDHIDVLLCAVAFACHICNSLKQCLTNNDAESLVSTIVSTCVNISRAFRTVYSAPCYGARTSKLRVLGPRRPNEVAQALVLDPGRCGINVWIDQFNLQPHPG